MAPRTTEDEACLNLSSSRFIISNISSLEDGVYFEHISRMTLYPHSLKSLILLSNLITKGRLISIPPLSARISLIASTALMTTRLSVSPNKAYNCSKQLVLFLNAALSMWNSLMQPIIAVFLTYGSASQRPMSMACCIYSDTPSNLREQSERRARPRILLLVPFRSVKKVLIARMASSQFCSA